MHDFRAACVSFAGSTSDALSNAGVLLYQRAQPLEMIAGDPGTRLRLHRDLQVSEHEVDLDAMKRID